MCTGTDIEKKCISLGLQPSPRNRTLVWIGKPTACRPALERREKRQESVADAREQVGRINDLRGGKTKGSFLRAAELRWSPSPLKVEGSPVAAAERGNAR